MTQKKAKRLITDMSFKGENAHMALVSVDQGGGANGVSTLLMKTAEDTSEMNSKQIESLKEIIKAVQGVSDEEASQMIGNVITDKEAGGVSPVSEVSKASNEAEETPNEDNKMSDVEQQEEFQKALAAKEAEMKAQYEELEKGLKAKLAEFETAKEAEVLKAAEQEALLYKSLGVTEETKGEFAVALMKAKGDDSMKPIMAALEKAQNIIKQVEDGTFVEKGHNVEATNEDLTLDEQLAQNIQKSAESK